MTETFRTSARSAVIGAGPAGLMAAEQLARAGVAVEVFEAMPSVARKLLRAGVGGLNLTHGEPFGDFLQRFGSASPTLQPKLEALPPEALRDWARELGVDTFVGSSGRVFPVGMKAAPLLRAWLRRLRSQGVVIHTRQRWVGWHDHDPHQGWRLRGPTGERLEHFDAVVLALGGGSWPRLGSDGHWQAMLAAAGVPLAPLRPANCGFEIPWSEHVREHLAGTPLKQVALTLRDPTGATWRRRGELLISSYGIEGSLVYALSAPLRDQLQARGPGRVDLTLDWLPDLDEEQILARLRAARPGQSLANTLRKQLRLPGAASVLLRECLPGIAAADHAAIAAALKAMPLQPGAPRPLAEAISSAGGVRFDAVDDALMLRQLPGVFVAGEMLDWEAPTGGYLLSACMATGRHAGEAAARWLACRDPK